MKKTAEEAARTRQDLLDAALGVFSRKGYHATRLVDIAAEAEVTRGAIYHHFGNKAGLYRELLDSASMVGNQIVAEAVQQGGAFIDILERILVMTFARVENDRRLQDIMALYLFNTDLADELTDIREKVRQESIAMIDGIAAQMQMGLDTAQLRPGISAHTYARSFIAYQNGVVDLWLGNPQAFSLTEEGAALADAFLRGFAYRVE